MRGATRAWDVTRADNYTHVRHASRAPDADRVPRFAKGLLLLHSTSTLSRTALLYVVYIAAVVLVGDGGGRLFASIARGHMRARRNWSARQTPPREQSTSRPTLGSPYWASTASRFRHGAIVVTRRRIRNRISVLPILPAAQWSSAGLSRSCASVRRSIGGATLACRRITRGGWDAREEATAAGFVDVARFKRRLNTNPETRAPSSRAGGCRAVPTQ